MSTIDELAGATAALRRRLEGGETMMPRELRALWSRRLRPFWRLRIEIYRALARRFLEVGENYLASEVADEGWEFFGDDAVLILIRALATARSGAPRAAQELLGKKRDLIVDAAEAKSLLARTFKDLWKASGEERYLREAFELYYQDYTATKGDRAFPGVNAASMALFLGRNEEARRIAAEVLAAIRVRSAAMGYWERVTGAECLLVGGEIEQARAAYLLATSAEKIPYAHLATTRAQARLLLRQLGHDEGSLDSCFPLPNVIAFVGHRLDPPNRLAPRFPEALAPAIKERIREAVWRAQAGFGYSAAANGADILFLEVMQEAGLETYVHLPLPEEEFIRQSVDRPDGDEWLARYRAVTANATEFICEEHAGSLAFAYGNLLLFGAACQHARQLGSDVQLLAVWDGLPGDGAGGTADYVRMVRDTGRPVEVIGLPATTTGSSPPPAPVEETEQLLSVLSFSLAPEQNEGASHRLAAFLRQSETVHREVLGQEVRLFFQTPTAAARAALEIGRQIDSTLGLHTGPMRPGTHALTGEKVIHGEHAAKAAALLALQPAGLIYASHAFAALLGLYPLPGVNCEFLGYRALNPSARREPIFQVRA
ncbi:hypothetical protein CfE428DRAFT_1118 [Chthoniobacter flavus Ellin428]|uniref:Uncharacterized protein n=1 Tax=Chthoniobacter flavus Ellin428 TaxID=497964 RepID=B4CWT0_9BACT|nr:tetratricopeptide repeat-containing protein [Chthoniobacter flavus]EDY21872.1 hypothetical protein CfE428DRAFT_1118 [Chthoniobacter flavus Ellin428]TCO95794.1 hypothetical protein EV701_101485 [Chthoniobacter flavus]